MCAEPLNRVQVAGSGSCCSGPVRVLCVYACVCVVCVFECLQTKQHPAYPPRAHESVCLASLGVTPLERHEVQSEESERVSAKEVEPRQIQRSIDGRGPDYQKRQMFVDVQSPHNFTSTLVGMTS
jgi:hypothetical protein